MLLILPTQRVSITSHVSASQKCHFNMTVCNIDITYRVWLGRQLDSVRRAGDRLLR